MIDLIQNMDWVLRVTLFLWILCLFMRFGGLVLIGVAWAGLVIFFPRVGTVTGIIGATAIWGLLLGRVVFTVWTLFILIGYML